MKTRYLIHKICSSLQIPSIKFHVTFFLEHHLLDLVAVLLVHVIAGLNRLVGADQSLLSVTQGLDGFLLALITDLPGLLLAVLGVAVLLSLLGASLHLKLADFLWLKVTILSLHRERKDIREFLTVPVDISLADLYLDLNIYNIYKTQTKSRTLPFWGYCNNPA